jgi:DNA-binding SARP family transcriptional activator/ABC-type branched-subunit amino acid transport system substrate-binding protein
MRFSILGPLEVQDGTRAVPLAAGRQRLLLAVLLVHAGETVSTDRLVDLLWDEAPPRTAARSLHNHVSALRKQLGDDVIATRGRGYALEVDEGAIDAERFMTLTRAGRAASAGGDHEAAAARFAEALALWRGSCAFGELGAEPSLRIGAGRLDDLRLSAIEQRLEADLALGRHAEVIGELESLVAEYPLRERLRGQLVLALYRAGRQADALDAYNNARRHLVDELGIEPGPELRRLGQAVLEQDPALGAPEALPTMPRAATHAPAVVRRHPLAAAWAGAVLLVAAALVGVLLSTAGEHARAPSRAPVLATGDASVATLDPGTARVVKRFPVGLNPTDVTVGAGAVWVINADQETITRVDLATSVTKTFSTGGIPAGIAADRNSLWVLQGARIGGRGPSASAVTTPVALLRIDPDSARVLQTISLPRPDNPTFGVAGQLVAAGDDAIWAVGRGGWVFRLDRRTGVLQTIKTLHASGVVAGGGQVWIRDTLGRLVRLASGTGRPTAHVTRSTSAVAPLAVGAGSLWLADPSEHTVWRMDTHTLQLVPIGVSAGVQRVTVGAGGVWTTNSLDRTIARIDPRTNRVTASTRMTGTPRGLAAGGGHIWVAVTGSGLGTAPAAGLPVTSSVKALPAAACGRVVTATHGRPRFLIASDLPLTGQVDATQSLAEATESIIARHGFRAGRFTVGFQACDDSVGQLGIADEDKCRSNAHSYAANPAVIGIVGPLSSDCAVAMQPILNTAPGGPVALVSPTNSDPELVRADPLSPGEIKSLFPTGQRGYARVYPSDDYEAAADAILADRLGHGAAFVLEDRASLDETAWKQFFHRAASRVGLRIRGETTWDPNAKSFADIGRQVRASGARVVLINGAVEQRLAAVVRAVLAAAGRRHLTLIGTQRMLNVPKLFSSMHGDARALLISSPGLPIDRLGPAGRRFVARFTLTQPHHAVTNFAVYAATATEVLLAAVARSDGTRESVARQLARINLRDSPIGPLHLDRHGELRSNPVAFVRPVDPHGNPDDIEGLGGSHTETVIRPPARLVGPGHG